MVPTQLLGPPPRRFRKLCRAWKCRDVEHQSPNLAVPARGAATSSRSAEPASALAVSAVTALALGEVGVVVLASNDGLRLGVGGESDGHGGEGGDDDENGLHGCGLEV